MVADRPVTTTYILLSAAVMLALAVVLAAVLIRAHRAWHVETDPRVAQVEAVLAHLDCGACGYPTCAKCAEAMVAGKAPPNACRPGGPRSAAAVARILHLELPEFGRFYSVVHCGAHWPDRKGRVPYEGERTCAAADQVPGTQGCTYGCPGLGDCQRACPFDAMHVVDGLATVDFNKCTACGSCAKACPRNIITIEPFAADRVVVVACSNHDGGKDTRAVCKVGCIACGLCQKTCELFEVTKNLSTIDYGRYDADRYGKELAAASEKCPTGCLPFRGREAAPA